MTKKIYFITSATGTVGSDLAKKLAQADPHHEIRCGTRNPSGASAQKLKTYGPNIQPVAFDADDATVLKKALADVTHLYLLPPFIPLTMVAWHQHIMQIAQEKGKLAYVVKHSVIGARPPQGDDMPGGLPLMHYRGEEVVMKSGIPYSVIRPTIFAQHFTTLPWVYQGGDEAFYLPIGQAKVAFLDARDIATLAAFLLTQADSRPYHGQAYTLTGPRGVTGPEMAVALSEAAGRRIRFVDPPESEFIAHIRHLSGNNPAVEGIANVYKEAKEGWFATPTPDFEGVMGFPTTTFAQFALDHTSYFRRQ